MPLFIREALHPDAEDLVIMTKVGAVRVANDLGRTSASPAKQTNGTWATTFSYGPIADIATPRIVPRMKAAYCPTASRTDDTGFASR